ncbi:MAG: chloride channel protein [Pseudomonadota bacterium]
MKAQHASQLLAKAIEWTHRWGRRIHALLPFKSRWKDGNDSLRKLGRNRDVLLTLAAVTVGAAAGAGAVFFRYAIDGAQYHFLGFASERELAFVTQLPWWQILLAPAIGGLVVGFLIKHVMPQSRPQGIADVIATTAQNSRIKTRPGLGAAVTSAISIGSGASVGREGPAVHFGAYLAGLLCTVLNQDRVFSRTMVGCGVASAVAASFNAPLAGALFAHEVVIGHYALRAFAPVVIAAVTGTIISRMAFGDFPAFAVPPHDLASFLEFPAFVLLGLGAAAIAVTLIRGVEVAAKFGPKLPGPAWTRPAYAGLAVGMMAIWVPEVMGVGYQATTDAMSIKYDFVQLVIILTLKLVATALCLGLGFAGGIFSPSMMLGAVAGAAFGIAATALFPDYSSGPSTYALVGMGAVAGAVLGAPVSTIFIVFELTGEYAITVAVMVATVIATLITTRFAGPSFFVRQLRRAGIDAESGRDVQTLRSLHVHDLMLTPVQTVPRQANLAEIRLRLARTAQDALYVVDEGNKLVGAIRHNDLSIGATDASLDRLVLAHDLFRRPEATVAQGATLAVAQSLIERYQLPELPVINSQDDRQIVGFIREVDVLRAVNRALLQARREERGEV